MLDETDIVVVGGGPVGLTLAHALGSRSLRTLVVERRRQAPERSMAIGITPPSLEIFRSLGLVESFLQRGVPITSAKVYENNAYLGTLDFSGVPSEFGFILSLPQSVTVQLLSAALSCRSTVQSRPGVECVGVEPEGNRVRVLLREGHVDSEVLARWVVGCDGHRSMVRHAADIGTREHFYAAWFMMSDFEDRTGWGHEARVFFGREGAVESFPMPAGLRRWIVQLPKGTNSPTEEHFIETIQKRTGHTLTNPALAPITLFQPKRMEAQRFFRGPIVLCGDAAHVMSPIGGQGMNTGFADAMVLARDLEAALRGGTTLLSYERERRRAFRRSAARAAGGMWIGTRRGALLSGMREWSIRRVFFHPWLKPRLATWFAMLPDFSRRATQPEKMDDADCCPEQLLRTVDQFATINQWFSRYRTLLRREFLLEMSADRAREYHLVDLGAGGCDIAVWLLGEAERHGLRLRVTAVELDPRIAAHAQRKHAEVKGLTVCCMDAFAIETLGRIDYVFSNHFLHHLEDEKAVQLLRLLNRVVARKAIASDLRRSPFSYFWFGIISRAFYRRGFIVDDGLLSIRKGFVPADWWAWIGRAGLAGQASVEELFPGRIILRVSCAGAAPQSTEPFSPTCAARSRNTDRVLNR